MDQSIFLSIMTCAYNSIIKAKLKVEKWVIFVLVTLHEVRNCAYSIEVCGCVCMHVHTDTLSKKFDDMEMIDSLELKCVIYHEMM